MDTHLAGSHEPVQFFQPGPRHSPLEDPVVLLGIHIQRLLIVHIGVLLLSFLPFILLFFHLDEGLVVLCVALDILVVRLVVVMCGGLRLWLLLMVGRRPGLREVEIEERRGVLAALDGRVRAARKVGRDEIGVGRDVAAGVLGR